MTCGFVCGRTIVATERQEDKTAAEYTVTL